MKKKRKKKMNKNVTKYLTKLLLIFFIGYALYFQLFKTIFDFFNKSKNDDFWVSILKHDLPNLIVVFVLIFAIIRIFKGHKS